ncbi:hypothetical protein N7540_007819 [Penicillium herquei]|nr:hypothetical protein N7540_007819 [Penicillium herquei]
MSPKQASPSDLQVTINSNKINLHGTNGINEKSHAIPQSLIDALYSESVVAKSKPPVLYPEFTDKTGKYVYRTLDFWTSGFFPGSMYLFLERSTRHPKIIQRWEAITKPSTPWPHPLQLEYLCRWWTANLHQNALRKDTHDLGFMIVPWAIKAWELNRDPAAYNSLIMAAHSLASRFNTTTQCLRSWDVCITNRYSFTDPSQDFLVIIDNMLNLDLLFWVAQETSNKQLYGIALAHARLTQKHHIRDDNSTFHVVNLDQESGQMKERFTNQGFSDSSCWSRGQAWGILGFMQTFEWTRDASFLKTAQKLANYFIENLPEDGVPYWDFSAPITDTSPRDTSAAMVAGCGMLLLYKALKGSSLGDYYLAEAIKLVDCTARKFLTSPTARLENIPSSSWVPVYPSGCMDDSEGDGFEDMTVVNGAGSDICETILNGATINNYEFAPRRWSNHGLVYADYYFMLFGNMLLDLGLTETQRC